MASRLDDLIREHAERLDELAGPIDLIDVTSRNDTTTVTWIDTEPPTRRNGRHRWPLIAVAAAVVAIAVGGLVVATRNDDPTRELRPAAQPTTTVVQPSAVAQPPVEVTACINPGPAVHNGTEETVVVPVTDGDMTILQSRGFTYRQSLTSSDPRLEGTLYQAVNQDDYTLPGDEPSAGITSSRPTGLAIGTFTNRIENDEGAWEGSAVQLDLPDGTTYVAPLVMTGEGAYEGLTAIVGFVDIWNDCAVTGYIIGGTVPAPPTPQTGQ
jgi:hypothetical protein